MSDSFAESGTNPDTFAHALKKACEAANARIYEYAMKNPDHRGLGTTATIALYLKRDVFLTSFANGVPFGTGAEDGGSKRSDADLVVIADPDSEQRFFARYPAERVEAKPR